MIRTNLEFLDTCSSSSIMVVAPGCSAELIQEFLEARILPGQDDLKILLPPDPSALYSQFLDNRSPSGEARFFSSPACRFFSTKHLKWLHRNLRSSRQVMVLVPKSIYQSPNSAMTALLILGFSGRTISILRHQDEGVEFIRKLLDWKDWEHTSEWISFELNFKIIANELKRILRNYFRSGNWDYLYLALFIGLLMKKGFVQRGFVQIFFPMNNKFASPLKGRHLPKLQKAKSKIIVMPTCPAEAIRRLLHDNILPAPANNEVYLFPQFPADDNGLLDKESIPKGTKINSSPAQSFFSTRHLGWLGENLQNSENTVLLAPKSPYQNPVLAMAALLTMTVSGKTLTLLYPKPEDQNHRPEPGESRDGQDDTSQWISRNLNLKFLAQEIGYHVWECYPDVVKQFFRDAEMELDNYFFETHGANPVNLQPLDASPEAIRRDVDYVLGIVKFWLKLLPGGQAYLKGKKVLEIGPGINFGAVLALACFGAEVMVVDRFLSPWDPDYHSKFYGLLRETLANRYAMIDLTPLDSILSKGGYPQACIDTYTCSLEKLSTVPDQSVDLTLSNAVFEHLYDTKSAFSHLARITKPGGFGFHQVDFRDHRDLSRPLEHLLLSNKEFNKEFNERHGECGNRFRPVEMQEIFESVGFQVKEFIADHCTEEEYLADFMERLRQAKKSRYRGYNAGKLRDVSGFFLLVRSQDKSPKKGFWSRLWGSGRN